MRHIILAAAVGTLAACGTESGGVGLGDGDLQYRATTVTGQLLLDGRLALTFPTDSTVGGSWQIQWSPGADTSSPVGPQVGDGTLAGTRHADTLVLELNPASADNNVSLVGVAAGGGLQGRWTWSAFAGPRSSGRFAAAPF
jgi:hypothetical protein